jgi:hypothetical protein
LPVPPPVMLGLDPGIGDGAHDQKMARRRSIRAESDPRVEPEDDDATSEDDDATSEDDDATSEDDDATSEDDDANSAEDDHGRIGHP